jgi:alkanesulfonate monooxygenase SsuD/methylene tetrahydromethanopterin reductase-like flavin-dependent oxidoreductase (luciferase family)
MLAVTGRLADGVIWSTAYVPPERLPDLHARIDQAAEAAGRSPEDVRRVYNLMGLIQAARGDQPLVGPVSQWVNELTRYAVDHGMDTFVYWPVDDHVRQLEVFAQEVGPAVRAAVARERGARRRP